MQNYTFDIKKVLTVACKLEVPSDAASEIDATLKALALACNYIHKIVPITFTSSDRIKSRSYQAVKEEFGLSPSLAICAIDRVAENRQIAQRSGSIVKEFKPTSAEYNVGIFSFREEDMTVSISLLDGQQRFKVLIGKHQLNLLKGQQLQSATLLKRQNSYYIHLHWEVIWRPG
ncbi:hypothetical protein [Kamptonema sp. UHCC 0994]|uniref:hypothetical protein n=1 Tax=Kamptonema sp. UHCC 0994 TaxID=3031329 RepID=UPI0023B911A1|nr:hypothetical protein [Kamptonema sp. UHCC 0994]MDF0553657.1 hypothetical protein [Kamptonema sp. UHCC 0994]